MFSSDSEHYRICGDWSNSVKNEIICHSALTLSLNKPRQGKIEPFFLVRHIIKNAF